MPHNESKPGFLSVTEVLNLSIPKPFLYRWYGSLGTQECERIKRESQEIGKAVHQEIQDRLSNTEWTQAGDENVARMVNNLWREFIEPWGVSPVELETTYENEDLKLQGTLDGIIKTNKGTYVVDWKTSNSLDRISIPLQLAAYAQLNGAGVWKGLAIRIDKAKDKIEIKEYSDLAPYWEVFKHCLAVAQYQKFKLKDLKDE